MDQFVIKRKDGSSYLLVAKSKAVALKGARQNWGLMGNDTVTITLESSGQERFEIGDELSVFGRNYRLNQLPSMSKIGAYKYSYQLTFEGIQYDLLRAFYDVTIETTGNSLQDIKGDTLTGDLRRFATVLIANANRVFPAKWALGACPDTVGDKTLTFGNGDNCLAVYQRLCKEFDMEAEITQAGGVYTVDFKKRVGTVLPYTFEYGKGKGLYALERQNVDNSNVVTRLKVYGSDKNISHKYRAQRLCLPNKSKAQSFIEESERVQRYGLHEARKVFDDIKPTFNGQVNKVITGKHLEFGDARMFDLNEKAPDGKTTKYLIAGLNAKVHFNTGKLAGYAFDIHKYDHTTKTFTLKPIKDDRGAVFPSATNPEFQIAKGDKYSLLDVTMPESYTTEAEERLKKEATEYYRQNSQPKVKYGLSISPRYLEGLAGSDTIQSLLSPGDYIKVKDESLGVDKAIRIQSLTRSLLDVYDYQLTLADVAEHNITTRVISELIELDKITTMNRLKDPTRAVDNWRTTREVMDMVFDPDGDYYTDKIKPNSIDTLALSVGAKSMQFGLTDVVFEPNHNGNKNTLKYSRGTLTHYTIKDTPHTWNIPEGTATFSRDDKPYYIFAKCDRSNGSASIVFSETPIKVEEDARCYHFWIGVVNSVDTRLNARSLSLSYGFSMINGGFIKTGRIESKDGTTYFDLERGEIGGNIRFRGGKDVTGVIREELDPKLREERRLNQGQIDAIKLGGRNLCLKTEGEQSGTSGHIPEFALSEDWQVGETYTFSCVLGVNHNQVVEAGVTKPIIVAVHPNRGFRHVADAVALEPFGAPDADGLYWANMRVTFTVTPQVFRDTEKRALALHLRYGGVQWRWRLSRVMLERGNKPSDYNPAPEDLQRKAKALADEAERRAKEEATQSINQAETRAKELAREEGEKAKTLARELVEGVNQKIDNDYLKRVLKDGTTDIKGGLVASNIIALKDLSGNVRSYIDGNPNNNIAFASGVNDFGKPTQTSTVAITHSGDAKIGQLHVDGGSGIITFKGDRPEPYLSIGGRHKSIGEIQTRFSATNLKSRPLNETIERQNHVSRYIQLISAFAINHKGGVLKIKGKLSAKAEIIRRSSMAFGTAVTSIILEKRGDDPLEYNQIKNWYARDEHSIAIDPNRDLLPSEEQVTDVDDAISELEPGIYRLSARIFYSGDSATNGRGSYKASAFDINYESTDREIAITNSSMHAMFSRNAFFHIDNYAFTIKHKLRVIGETDIPGVLASGRINAEANALHSWGAKAKRVGLGALCQLTHENHYIVYHNVGHTNYSVQLTPLHTSHLPYIMDIQKYSFTCAFHGQGNTTNWKTEFFYLILGHNEDPTQEIEPQIEE